MIVKRTDEEVNELLNRCSEAEENGESAYPGMTYEQGIKAMAEWLEGGDYPFD